MNTPQTGSPSTPATVRQIDMRLEVIVIPVSDVARAKRFYEGLGWRIDADIARGDAFRIVQVTPPGSGCSVAFGTGLTDAPPGSARGLELIVSDIEAARDDLLAHGVERVYLFHGSPWSRVDGLDPERQSYRTYGAFADPDGNEWLLQEVTTRLPGHIEPGTPTFGSVGDLAAALRRAEAAYGERDANRAHWYAAYLAAEQSGDPLPA